MNKIFTHLFIPVIITFVLSNAVSAVDVIDYRNRLSRQVLTSSHITAITKDANGFIWIASKNELVRFDGTAYYNIESSANKTLFSNNNTIQNLYFQAPDLLLICSNNGLFTYNIRKHTLIWVKAFAGIRINSLIVKKDRMYLNSQKGLLLYLPKNEQSQFLYRFNQRSLPTEYTSLAVDTLGNCWISANKYLLRLPPFSILEKNLSLKKLSKADTIQKFKNNNRVKIDQYNTIWMWDREILTTANLTADGQIRNANSQEKEISALLIKGNLVFMCNRGKENVWLYRSANGLVTERQVFQVNQQYDDLSNTTNVFYADESNNIWIGTRDGLFMLPYGEKSKMINIRNDIKNPNTLSHNTVSDIYIESRNTAWVATAYGLNKITFSGPASNPYKIERFFDTRSSINYVLDNKIECITVNKTGEMWLGTKGNVKIYNPRKNTYYSKPVLEQTLKHCSFVRALYRDDDDDIWIGFENGGIFCHNQLANTVTEIKPGSRPINCTAITGNNGIIWIGTKSDGILRIDKRAGEKTGPVKQYKLTDTLHNKPVVINCIYNDKYNNVWIGADNGLFKYNYEKDKFIYMPVDFSGGPRYIAGLIHDTRGNLWMATLSGVYKYNISEGSCQLISLFNGNFMRQGFVFGCDIDSDGFLYMGGINGLTIFNPNEISYNASDHKVLFTDFRVHNKILSPGSGILDQDINYTDQIVLNHGDNQFSFAFSAMTFANRENIRYSYMLEGVDESWIFAGPEERYISYNNLPPGKYTLKIRSTNNNGIWQENVHTLGIRISPPLYKTWYFYVLYVTLSGGIIWLLVYFWSLRVKLRSQTKMEQHKLKFYTDLIHSIKTPLTLLQSPLQNIIRDYDIMSDDEIRYMLSTMNSNSSRLTLLVEQLVEFRKVSQGKAALNLTETDFIRFINGIYNSFKELFELKNISFTFSADVNEAALVFDSEKMEIILFNLLSNAYKFTAEGGTVHLSCTSGQSDHKLWIEVKNVGVGGAGIGLPLAKELIELHYGKVYLNNIPENGASIRFYLLTGTAHFQGMTIGKADQGSLAYVHMNNYLESETLSHIDNEPYLPNAALVYMVDEDPQIPAFIDKVCRPSIKIVAFSNPKALYEETLKQKPKLILSALVFDGEKSGLDLCEKIRNNPGTNDIPFIFISSYSSPEDQKTGYEFGADGYIAKPFDVNHLKTRIIMLLKSTENIREKIRRELMVSPREVRLQSADDKFLAKAMELIEKHIADEALSVDQFASKMNLSPSMLYRKIKALTNLSPNELIRSVRLKRAAQLLTTKAYTISEIAFKVGFVDIRYFSSCFKKEFGVPPSVYQQKTTIKSSPQIE